jgi:hypothetical protein
MIPQPETALSSGHLKYFPTFSVQICCPPRVMFNEDFSGLCILQQGFCSYFFQSQAWKVATALWLQFGSKDIPVSLRFILNCSYIFANMRRITVKAKYIQFTLSRG